MLTLLGQGNVEFIQIMRKLNAQAGYIYNLNLARENFWDGSFFIDGSWSPDSH